MTEDQVCDNLTVNKTSNLLGNVNVSGNIGIGTQVENPNTKLGITGGDIHIETGRTFYNNGRMHVSGEELLFLLNKSGVVIGKEWDGNGNLTVEGNINVNGDIILANADCAEENEHDIL